MSEEVGSLRVGLALDSATFDKSLASINRNIKGLGQEMSIIRGRGNEWGNSVEGLGTKQSTLTTLLESQKAKVQQLNESYQRAVTEQGANSTAAENLATSLNRATAEMVRTETELSQVSTALQQQQDDIRLSESSWTRLGDTMQAAGDRMKKVGDKMKGVGESLSTAVTLPLAALGAGAITVADQFDTAQGRIQAQLGLTSGEAEELHGVAKNLWKNAFGESVGEVGDSLAIIKQSMKDLNNGELEKVAESAYILKDAFGAEINETTRTASVLMKTFGVESQEAFDLMTVGFQRGGDFSDELLDTLREYAPQFEGLGYSAEEFTAILVAGAESGAFNLDKLGDVAKEAFLRIGDGSKTSRQALDFLGLDLETIETGMASGGDTAKSAFAAVASAIAGVEDPAYKTQTAIALLGAPIEDLGPEFQDFFARVDTDLGNFEGSTASAGEALYDNFGSRMTSVFREFQAAIEPIGSVLLDMAENLLPKVSAAVETVSNWFANLSPVAQQLSVVFGLVAAAIGPLLIVGGTLVSAIGSIIGVMGTVSAAIAVVTTGVASTIPAVTALAGVFTLLTGPVGIAIAAIVGVIAILVLTYNKVEWFRNAVNATWEIIKKSTVVAFEAIKKTISTMIDAAVKFASTQLGKFKEFWDANGQQISSIVKFYFGQIKSNIELVLGVIKGIFQVVFPIISNIVRITFEAIKLVISTGINLALGIVQTVLKILQGDWKGAWETIKTTVVNIWTDIKAYLKAINLVQTGKDIINGLIKGIGSMATAVWDKVKSITDGIKKAITGALDIHSPSRVMEGYGVNIGQGLANGIKQMNTSVKKSADEMALASVPPVASIANPKNYSGASMNNQTHSVGTINITIPASDIKEFADVTDFFKRLPQVVNQY